MTETLGAVGTIARYLTGINGSSSSQDNSRIEEYKVGYVFLFLIIYYNVYKNDNNHKNEVKEIR